MKAAIYDTQTGTILKWVNCPPDMVDLQTGVGEDFYLNCPSDATHIIDNEPVTLIPEPVPPTDAEIIAMLTGAVQSHLDIISRQRNYDGILSLCTYSTSTDPVFAAEGQAGVEWRDAVWRTSYQIMAAVKAGTRGVPTREELIAELPAMVWPVAPN